MEYLCVSRYVLMVSLEGPSLVSIGIALAAFQIGLILVDRFLLAWSFFIAQLLCRQTINSDIFNVAGPRCMSLCGNSVTVLHAYHSNM